MDAAAARTFRLPAAAYLVVLLLAFGVTALVQNPILLVAYVIPALAAVYIHRTATVVDAELGITVRALIGQTRIGWDELRGLSFTGRNLYAVARDGAIRLPCVRLADLAAVSAASGGHLPQFPEATPKYAPSGRRRR